MISEVSIRPAAITDAQDIAVAHVASWRIGYAGLIPEDFLAALSVEARTAAWEMNVDGTGAGRTLVGVVDERVLGFASVGPVRDEDAQPGTGELWALYTHPDAWGRGVGTALIAAAVRELQAAGFVRATLWVLAGNDLARGFYEGRGWELDGRTRVDWLGGVRLDEVRYERLTDPAPAAS